MPSPHTTNRIIEFARRFDDLDLNLIEEGLRIAHLHHEIDREIETHTADWGLTARQVAIMEIMFHNADQTLTPAELADEVGLTRSAMTSALDALEKAGHATRAPHPSDRRMIAIALTDAGRKLMQQVLPPALPQDAKRPRSS